MRTLSQLKEAIRTQFMLGQSFDQVSEHCWLNCTNDNWSFDYILHYVCEHEYQLVIA